MNKIFGIGLSRTGTTTLTHVLKDLGYNIVHYPRSEKEIQNTDGATDIPVTVRYKELDKMYPGSKFIYTIRNREQWIESIVPYLGRKKTWKGFPQTQVNIRTQMYGDPFPNAEQAALAYDKHDKDVREYFKGREQDLLILDIVGGDTVDMLTDFLGCSSIGTNQFPVYNTLKKK